MDSCGICIEKFNKRSRKRVECSKCNMEICSQCVKRYILDLNDVPQCMNCKCGYTSNFLCDIYSNKFFNGELRDSQVDLFFNTEKSKLVGTAERMEVERVKQEKLDKLQRSINELQTALNSVRLYSREYYKLRDQIYEVQREWRNVKYNNEKKVQQRVRVSRSCPVNDCRGFLNQNWKCGICEKNTCSDCYCVKEKDHKCKKEDIETFELIKRDTKQCPNCNYGIYRISGCSQMYCTECHTCFDWNTLRICTGAIHNPHYFEYMRKKKKHLPRQPGDIPGTCLSVHTITSFKSAHEAMFLEYFRFFNHIRAVDMPRFPTDLPEDGLEQWRRQYLTNNMDEKQWKKHLKSVLKKKEKNLEMNQILEMFCTAGSSILNNLNEKNGDDILNELEEFKKYTNEQLDNLSCKYKNNVIYIVTEGTNLRSKYLDLY